MEKHYNFENGVKGKFYVPENELQLPVYLDFDLQKTLLKLANETNKSKINTHFVCYFYNFYFV